MNNQSLLLTICIPVFNGEHTLKTAIESACGVSGLHYEILISDNASTDATATICKKYGEAIRYHRNMTNLGYAGNYKQCLKVAGGRYLYFMGADDVVDVFAITQLVFYLEDHPDIALVSSNIWYWRDQSNRPTRCAIYFNGWATSFTAGEEALNKWLFHSVLGSIGGYLLRSSVAKKFETQLPATSIIPQMHLAAQIARHYPVAHLPLLTMGQRMSDTTKQLANRNYLSLSPVNDCLELINNITSGKSSERLLRRNHLRQKMINTYLNGLVWNIVTYRSFGSAKVHRALLKLLLHHQPTFLIKPTFLFFALATLVLPQTATRRLLVWYRNGWRKSNLA